MVTCLPDTDIAAVAIGDDVFTYMQSYQGVLMECHGSMQTVEGTEKVYLYDDQSQVIQRYRGGKEEIRPGGPKMFTPLAVAYIKPNIKHLFYVNDKNILHGCRFNHTTKSWEDAGISSLAVTCASYSRIAAIGISRNNFQAICVYFQNDKRKTGIEMVSFSTKNSRWGRGEPDMEPIPTPPPPPVNVRDPPLYGTSLAAVPNRPGIGFVDGSELPVVFLQWDNLGLAHAQASEVEVVPTLNLRFAPHTSLTTIDDGEKIHLFYVSSKDNLIKRLCIGNNGRASKAQALVRPTPRSALAVVIPSNHRMVLFYQSLDDDEGTVNLAGLTFLRPATTADPNIWPFVGPEELN